MNTETLNKRFGRILEQTDTLQIIGRLQKVVGMVVESDGPKGRIGEICVLRDRYGKPVTRTEIVGFKESNKILSMVLGDLDDIQPGMEMVSTGKKFRIPLSEQMLGRVIDGLGNPLDGKGPYAARDRRSIYNSPPNPLERKVITEPLYTGIKSIDGLLTIGKGQRVGVFAGSGVGKSTLIGEIAKNTSADVNVIALIGERGREVKEFIENELGPEGLRKSVVIVATSDQPALIRVKAALVATTVAEYFRDQGMDVMMMMDSATRLAMAQREVGLAIGEPPTTKGYTPSVFRLLQQTMERTGTSKDGSISALYTILVEGDDFNEPISDAARGILDGHIMLTRKLANKGHYPAVDVLSSISRVMNKVIFDDHNRAARKLKELMGAYAESEDLISIGAYEQGINPLTDRAIMLKSRIDEFLKQDINENISWEDTIEQLIRLTSE